MHGMTPIVKTVTRGMAGMIFLYGIYIILHGHLTPGGGFAGGVMVAAAFVLIVLANGSQDVVSEAKKRRSSVAESLGIFAFWGLAMMGLIGGTFVMLLSGGDWATNWPIFLVIAGGVIVFVAIATYLARIIIK